MIYVYILCSLILLFFLVRNIVALGEYRSYQKDAVFVFEDQRKSFRVSRIVFGIFFVIFLSLIVFLLFRKVRDFQAFMILVSLAAGSALFCFVPYTNGRFVVTDQGIYVYNALRLIKWSEIINFTLEARKKDSYLILNTSRAENERMTRTNFPLLVTPSDKTPLLRDLIRDMIALEAKKQRLDRIKNGV